MSKQRRLNLINSVLQKWGWRLHHDPGDPFLRRVSDLSEKLRFEESDAPGIEGSLMEMALEAHLRRLIANEKPGLAVDVGANRGQFAAKMRSCGYEGDMISIEPDPASFELLQKAHPSRSNQINFQGAVGSSEGNCSLQISKSSVFNSVRRTSDLGNELFENYMEGVTMIEVPMKPLGTWIREAGRSFSGPIMLKSDTQGYDLEVLRGAQDVLSNVSVIVVEYALEHIYDGAPSGSDITEWLNKVGFRLSGLYPVSRIPGSEFLLEMDAIYVADREASAEGVPK